MSLTLLPGPRIPSIFLVSWTDSRELSLHIGVAFPTRLVRRAFHIDQVSTIPGTTGDRLKSYATH